MVEAAHAHGMDLYGGLIGSPDEQKLEGALGRPLNLIQYGGNPSVFEVAACYGSALAKAHAFLDGNNRVAFLTCYAFLSINGYQLDADEVDAAATFKALAAGHIEEDQLAGWLKQNCIAKG